MANRPVILSIAGYDPSSGAGITADVKTAAALGCYAVTCITALTVQSTQGVFGVESVRPEMVRETLERLKDDVRIDGVRIGMLGSGAVAGEVAAFLQKARPANVVLDPVLRSSSGASLIDESGIELIRNRLLPLVEVVTPNLEEAAILGETDAPAVPASWDETLPLVRRLTKLLHDLGSKAVVITGGHLDQANDFLSIQDANGVQESVFPGSRIETAATHGTGCAFATALTCLLARGRDLPESVRAAKEFVRRAMLAAYPLGKGIGPMNHLFRIEEDERE